MRPAQYLRGSRLPGVPVPRNVAWGASAASATRQGMQRTVAVGPSPVQIAYPRARGMRQGFPTSTHIKFLCY